PTASVGLEDEGVVAGDRVLGSGAVRRNVRGGLLLLEVRVVGPHPFLLRPVPPDQLLALRPRLALGIRRGAVVENPAVQRPGPAPLLRDPVLLLAGHLARGLVLLVRVGADVEPAARRRRAVALQVGVGSERRAVRADAVDRP